MPGEDRLGWLHTLTTQHLTELRAGQGTELLVLSPHGHVEHHAMVTEDGDDDLAGHRAGRAPARCWTYLQRMRFFMRVEPADVTAEWAMLSLVGPEADAALGALGVDGLAAPDVVPVPGPKFAAGSVPPRPTIRYDVARCRPAAGRAGCRSGWTCWCPGRGGRRGRRAARAGCRWPGSGRTRRCGWRPAGRGWASRPTTGRMPAEVGLVGPAVHLDKGCYRGQETVARVHNLGRPPRRLVLLHLDGVATDELPAAGTPVTADGRRSVSSAPRCGTTSWADRAGGGQANVARRRARCWSGRRPPRSTPGRLTGRCRA